MDRIQYHFGFLPGNSYTGAPLVNAIICVNCYEDLLQEHPVFFLVPATSRSEVSQGIQAGFSPIKSEEPKEAFTGVQKSADGTTGIGNDLQVKASENAGSSRKRPPSHPILARDLRSLYQGLPPGDPPLPRKPRKKRRRWKLNVTSNSRSEPDKDNLLAGADNEATAPFSGSASKHSITEGEHTDSELSAMTALAEPLEIHLNN